MAANSRFYFVLLSVCAAAGMGNIFLFPYLSYKLTGLFFIPYLIALLILGIPLLMLEFSIGQHFNRNIVDIFASIKKWFSSIGWLMALNAFILMSAYAVMISYCIIYFFVSLGFQWKNDPNSYFFNNVVQASNEFSSFAHISLPVFIALIFAWIAIFLFVRNGFESIKKGILAISAPFAALLLFFMIYALSLDNALAGIHAFLKPDFRNLFNPAVWISSFSLAAVSLGVSFGIMPAFARRSENGFIAGTSFIVIFLKILGSVAIGFITFSIIGFLSLKQQTEISTLAFYNSRNIFTTLAQALPFFYRPTLLSMLFFAFMSLFFVFGAASLAYSLVHLLSQKLNSKKRNAAILVCGLGFLAGIVFATRPGYFMMDLVLHFIYYNILLAILLEALAVGWFYDAGKISEYINQNSNVKLGGMWKLAVKYAVPLVIIFLLALQLRADILNGYGNYSRLAMLAFGAGTVAVPVIIAFLLPQKILDK